MGNPQNADRVVWVRIAILVLALFATGPACALPGSVVAPPGGPALTPGEPRAAMTARAREALERLPLHFIENDGQLDPRVAYYVQGRDTTVYFTSEGVTIALTGPATTSSRSETGRHRGSAGPVALRTGADGDGARQRWAVKLDFVGANPTARARSQDPTPAVVSYFKGPSAQWRTGLKTYAGLVYRDLWPGIDLVFNGDVSRVKYTFVIHPGADADRIRLAYRGATAVTLTDAGELQVSTPAGGFRDERPYAYQDVDGQRIEVASAYALDAEAAGGAHGYGFRLGTYDRTRPLVLDPAMLVYAGYIGGAGDDRVEQFNGIAVDNAGNAYVTGLTSSSEATFPVAVGPDLTFNGSLDAFVAKVNAAGTSLVYAGYIGGAGQDVGNGIAVDSAGNAYIAGQTSSSETTFPVTVGPDLTFNGFFDAFVAKVNAAGTGLVYAGYIGGVGNDNGMGIAVDSAGNAYVSGATGSSEATFPVTVGPDLTFNGGQGDAFVAKVNATGTGLVYAGYIGGTADENARGIAVDNAGNAYVTGHTGSSDLPVTVGPDLTFNGFFDAFVAKVNAAGTGLLYAGYIGGLSDDFGSAIAVDSAGNAYVSGGTGSSEASFPVTGGPDLTFNGGPLDAFVAKVNATGTALVYAGYIGGSGNDFGVGIALDSAGNAHVTGGTNSSEATFPATGGPDLTFNGGAFDAFVAKVNAAGTALVYAGYIGGAGDDRGHGIAVDSAGNAYVAGLTNSSEATFPVTVGPDLTYNGGPFDAFVAKVAEVSDEVSTPGKVTGGGAIDADGTILTLATLLIQNGSSPGGKATFGFVVEFANGSAAPMGNLTYHDHELDIRIKANAYDLLVITEPSPVCPLVGRHAKFTGTADVNGVQEIFEVEVDDCGEPGDADTFSITTESYAASGVLIGGNIQIHPAP